MKHNIVFSFLILTLFAGCHSQSKTVDAVVVTQDSPAVAVAPVKLLGSYVGGFGNNKITLLISKASGDTIEGRSVVGGNDRPFNGISKMDNGIYSITVKEPGDDKDDGVFNFKVDSKQPDIITGSWAPDSPTATLMAKTYSLQRKAFKYYRDSGFYPESSQKILKEDDVNNKNAYELEIMRNEIFARHGYCFKNKEQRDQFEPADWYVPDNANVTDSLTAIEKKNIILIKKYEKYALAHGDDFGR